MATAMATKPPAPHQQPKMKRPPLPAVQTNIVQSSQTSPSPSTATKRLPSASFKAPPTPTIDSNAGNGNGVGARLSNRRRDSQRPQDLQGRIRSAKDGERKVVKRRSEPYVKDQAYILKKYKDATPSMTIHLHKNIFRIEQLEGSFSYTSPMKFVLEHLRDQTIPHEMVEELNAFGAKFYEGTIIVQVKDYRNASHGRKSSSEEEITEFNKPFSLHNYNSFVTPSPSVPYPELKKDDEKPRTNSQEPESDTSPTHDQSKDTEPKTFTVVLFPTPLSISEEVAAQANTPADARQGTRKQSLAVPRTPASATIPQMPLSAVPPTPSIHGPHAKRQKMSISGSEIREYESKLIHTYASPLYLEPASNVEDMHHIIGKLTDKMHNERLPAPRYRKRTVAELAADEAQAASAQAFMLIMDDRIGSNNAVQAKAAGTDEAGAAPFEPRFERFNYIQSIKTRLAQEKAEKITRDIENKRATERHEAEQHRLHQDRMRQEQAELALRAQDVQRNQQLQQERNRHLQQQRAAMAAANQNHHPGLAHPAAMAHSMTHGHPNGILPNGLHSSAASAVHHSSPVMRDTTPHSNPSPVVGSTPMAQPGAVPMNITSSGQGHPTSSPARPQSAVHNSNPATQAMARQHSRQQNPSRTGTPLINGTPSMAHATPPMGNVTPIPRLPQGSPPNPGMVNAMMNNGSMMNAHLHGGQNGNHPQLSQLTPQQQQQFMERMQQQRNHQQRMLQQSAAAAQHSQMQGSPNQQMTPERAQALQNLAAQNQARREQQQNYQRQMAQHHANINGGVPPNGPTSNAHGHPQLPNGASPAPTQNTQPQPSGQHPNAQQMAQNAAQQQARNAQQGQSVMHAKQVNFIGQQVNRELQQLVMTKYGGNPNLVTLEEKQMARRNAESKLMQAITHEKQKAAAHQHQQAQINRQHQQMYQNLQQLQGHNVGAGAGALHAGMAMGMRAPGGGGQALTPQQQQQQQMMAQMAQMSHLGGGGVPNMNGMNGMNGMGANGANSAIGGGMNGLQ